MVGGRELELAIEKQFRWRKAMDGSNRDIARDIYSVVSLRGDCDLYSAPGFKAAMLEKIKLGARYILIDMTELSYLDSSGVGAIISILQSAKRAGGEVKFQGLKGGPRRVLERTSLLPIMNEART
jgi:anti-anti-sigma factor